MPIRRFAITSDCQGCQAFSDAKELFTECERLGRAHDLDPDRLARALAALVSQWTAVTAEFNKGRALTRAETDALVGDVLRDIEYSLRTYLTGAKPQHQH